jgi:hypothetical protein
VLTRAYADWSAEVNAGYQGQLVARAVDLVQLFPAAAYGKNGADIRLAVDTVEDMFRLPDLTHVVIVAGDSDYIALAQRCKRLGCAMPPPFRSCPGTWTPRHTEPPATSCAPRVLKARYAPSSRTALPEAIR